MPWNINNKLLPIVAVVTLLALFFVLLNSCGSDEASPTLLAEVPVSPEPDADSPADTIKTLTANVSELLSEVDALRNDNADLHEAKSDMETEFANRIASEITQYHQSQSAVGRRSEGEVSQLREQVESLAEQIEGFSISMSGSDIPLGIGLDGLAQDQNVGVATSYFWINPLDVPIASGEFGAPTASTQLRPVITIPRNATLVSSTAMTALIGRVPIQGQLRDPMPFKVLTGEENLAANGLTIYGLQGMVWSGYAVGDWTLGCVSGRLESATFIFDNGTIQTISAGGGNASSSQSSLGWISDEYGVPCITGERKSNAVSFLAQQAGLDASQAAANAAASLETMQSFDGLGNARSLITGDAGKYVLGKTLAGGTQATAAWLELRASQEFDAVYVAPGQKVAIHIDREIRIDYDREGRKLDHDQSQANSFVFDID
ncbi:MAG: TIGR03752 family integrating conjugative element protein [Gammaproteobacteria bacterium]|nr:TIGR03752 family integrating conjugative element protein [Gammaproteobacteria bacterium]